MSVTDGHASGILNATQRRITMKLDHFDADSATVSYSMLPGTQPDEFGCFLAVWQDEEQIGWDSTTNNGQAPLPPQQRGRATVHFDKPQQRNHYVLGLSVGPMRTVPQRAANIAASIYKADTNAEEVERSDSLRLVKATQNLLTVRFECLPGCRPALNGAWMGAWRGNAASHTQRPDWATNVTQNDDSGVTSFKSVSLGMGVTYTVGLFKSGWSDDPAQRVQRTLSASLTFTEGES